MIHTYQKYDPRNIPSPTQPPPDLVSGAFEHLLSYGDIRELTDEELARAVRIDPSQIAGLGPSLESLMAMLRERKRKILETYETDRVQAEAAQQLPRLGREMHPPRNLEKRFQQALGRGATPRHWNGSGTTPATTAACSPGSWCSSSTAWATSTRSTSWRPSTSSPAARR